MTHQPGDNNNQPSFEQLLAGIKTYIQALEERIEEPLQIHESICQKQLQEGDPFEKNAFAVLVAIPPRIRKLRDRTIDVLKNATISYGEEANNEETDKLKDFIQKIGNPIDVLIAFGKIMDRLGERRTALKNLAHAMQERKLATLAEARVYPDLDKLLQEYIVIQLEFPGQLGLLYEQISMAELQFTAFSDFLGELGLE
jgi:hypothetical protein